MPNRHICQDEGIAHKLRVTVRAWHDPYIKAAELTHGSMDFGLSGSMELITGSVWLGSKTPGAGMGLWSVAKVMVGKNRCWMNLMN